MSCGRRRGSVAMLLLLLLALLAPESGCSFVFVSGPPPPAERTRGYDCTRSRVAPVIDVGLAALALAGATYAGLASDEEYARVSSSSREVAIPLALAWTAVYGVSAIIGFRRADSCREAVSLDPGNYRRSRHARRRQRAEEAAEEEAVQQRLEEQEEADEAKAK